MIKLGEKVEPTTPPDWIAQTVGGFIDRAFALLDQAKTRSLEGQEEWVNPLPFRLSLAGGSERTVSDIGDRYTSRILHTSRFREV